MLHSALHQGLAPDSCPPCCLLHTILPRLARPVLLYYLAPRCLLPACASSSRMHVAAACSSCRQLYHDSTTWHMSLLEPIAAVCAWFSCGIGCSLQPMLYYSNPAHLEHHAVSLPGLLAGCATRVVACALHRSLQRWLLGAEDLLL